MATDTPPCPAVASRRSLPIGRWLLIGAVLGWFGLLILVPAAELARRALAEGPGPLLRALMTPECARAFGMTLGVTALATAINTVFGVVGALVLERQRFRGRALADGLVDLPFAVSPVVAGLMLVVLYGPSGFVGRWLEANGLRVIYAWPGMVLATTFVTIPFVVREVAPVLREFGDEQEQAAATLGAGRRQTFWRVTFPTIRWALAYGVTLTVARSLGEFGALLVVSGDLFGRTQTATLFVHDAVESFDLPGAYAASIVLAALSVLILVGMESLRRRVAARENTNEEGT